MNQTAPINHPATIGPVLGALEKVHEHIDTFGLDRSLHHLIELRASQINRCAYCVKMHAREARADQETNERLDRLIVWNHTNDFAPKEKAALAWTEALTVLDSKTNYGELRAELRKYFSDSEIGAITATVAMINLWNRMQISTH